jgi:acyl-CoA reductase-like NAD-dependent aldehyde dehydrogenase
MRHLDHVHVPQLDLFRPASPSPTWRQLPAEARERVLRLMTRLLRERRNRLVHALAAGGRNDE